jgi:hypothetical protein
MNALNAGLQILVKNFLGYLTGNAQWASEKFSIKTSTFRNVEFFISSLMTNLVVFLFHMHGC